MKLCWKDRIIACCIVLLYVIAFAILGKAFVAKVIVKHCGISNAITDFVMEGEDKQTESRKVAIDWKKLYPFEQEEEVSFQEKIEHKLNDSSKPEKRLTEWIRKNLWGYWDLVEKARLFDRYMGWNLYRQDGAEIKMFEDGYLVHAWPQSNMEAKIVAVINFYQFCQEQNIPLLFVQAPAKIDRGLEQQNQELNGYANENADKLLIGLRKHGIHVLDIRNEIEKRGMNIESLFFKTDHHWKPQTALWATGLIVQTLQKISQVHLLDEKQFLSSDMYEEKVYSDNFLGSSGRTVTLARARPENISLFFPKENTDFTYVIPELGLNKRGEFSEMYDMTQVRAGDFYNKNSYAAYGYGDKAYIHIENHKQTSNKKILLIKDSFGDAIGPFLAMNTTYLDIIDLRAFNGSLQSFIKENKPDVIIILYSANVESAIRPWGIHGDPFDFR